ALPCHALTGTIDRFSECFHGPYHAYVHASALLLKQPSDWGQLAELHGSTSRMRHGPVSEEPLPCPSPRACPAIRVQRAAAQWLCGPSRPQTPIWSRRSFATSQAIPATSASSSLCSVSRPTCSSGLLASTTLPTWHSSQWRPFKGRKASS